MSDVKALYAAFQLPVWVTEFACQTHAESVNDPTRWTQAEVDAFMHATAQFMEAAPFVQRYAWHDSVVGTSALYTSDGQLTASGRTYAAL